MNLFSVASVLVLIAMAASGSAETTAKPQYNLDEGPMLFESYIKEHNKQYKDDADRQAHYEAFLKSLKSINELNAKSDTATYGLNKFADYTPDEKQSMFGLKRNKN